MTAVLVPTRHILLLNIFFQDRTYLVFWDPCWRISATKSKALAGTSTYPYGRCFGSPRERFCLWLVSFEKWTICLMNNTWQFSANESSSLSGAITYTYDSSLADPRDRFILKDYVQDTIDLVQDELLISFCKWVEHLVASYHLSLWQLFGWLARQIYILKNLFDMEFIW